MHVCFTEKTYEICITCTCQKIFLSAFFGYRVLVWSTVYSSVGSILNKKSFKSEITIMELISKII